jgi:hypothetical protein
MRVGCHAATDLANHHHHGHPGTVVPEVLQDRQAGDSRHEVIEQDAIKFHPVQFAQGVVPIFGSLDPVPATGKALSKGASEFRVVIDDEKMCPHHESMFSKPSE